MITSYEQARNTQARRVAVGKRGFSRAVRRFVQRDINPATPDEWKQYHAALAKLPHNPIIPNIDPASYKISMAAVDQYFDNDTEEVENA